MIIEEIIKKTINLNVSDIIFSPNAYPCVKINGEIHSLSKNYEILKKETLDDEILSLMNEDQEKQFLANLELDFSFEIEGNYRYRVNCFKQKNGFGAVFRPIKDKIPDFENLGLPESILKTIDKMKGLFLITGSVGSGKSTTLASILNYINKNYKKHIITIEDPIEFIYKNEKSLIEQREVGISTLSFDNGLKYCLRQACDVIMVGEMRDLETFRLALRAAETGNLVLATLHTSGAARTIDRVIDMFPGDEKEQIKTQLSESLLGVTWVDLIKTKDGNRTSIVEVMVNNTSIRNMIRKGNNHQINSVIETGNEFGMVTMKKSLDKLLEDNLIDENLYNNYLNNLKAINL